MPKKELEHILKLILENNTPDKHKRNHKKHEMGEFKLLVA